MFACGDPSPGGQPTPEASSDAAPEPEPEPEPEPSPEPEGAEAALSCVIDPGAEATGVALEEASGAAWIDTSLGTGWVAVSDKGGAVLLEADILDASELELPLGQGGSKDLEGLAIGANGWLYALASSGTLRAWQITSTLALTALPPTALTGDADWSCEEGVAKNCGPDWEGLCLDPAPGDAPCVGWAASKAHGQLVCLEAEGAGLRLEPETLLSVAPEGQLSGCAYELEAPHRLLVAQNGEGLSALSQVRGHRTPGEATVLPLGLLGAERQEAIAFGPEGALLSLGDGGPEGGDTSPVRRFSCQ